MDDLNNSGVKAMGVGVNVAIHSPSVGDDSSSLRGEKKVT